MPKKVNFKNETLSTNKVYEVILAMNKADRRRCLKFLESPFFSSSATLLSLYGIFLKIAEVNGERGFSKESIWLEMFGDIQYNDVNFRKSCSDLFRLIEKFLSNPVKDDVDFYQHLHIVENIREKKITPLYTEALSNFEGFLFSHPQRNSRFHYFSFKKSSLQYEMQEKSKLYKSRVNFEEISYSLDVYYLIEKLKLLCSVVAHERLINTKYKILLVEQVTESLSNFKLENEPGLSLFYYTYLLMKNPESDIDFHLLKENLFKNWHFLSNFEIFDVLVTAMNFCTNRTNKGDKKYYNEYFDLVRFGNEKSLFVINGVIEDWRFNNFVYSSLQINEIEWAENFIENYKQYLLPEQRESTVSFNQARLYRKKGEFKKVIEVLRNVEYADLGYNTNGKIILMMAYFDLDEYDSLDSLVDSFKVYLTRHKDISTQKRKLYLNFIKYTRRLMKLIPGDNKAMEKFKQDLQKEKSTTVNHDWLLEKIAELEQGNKK